MCLEIWFLFLFKEQLSRKGGNDQKIKNLSLFIKIILSYSFCKGTWNEWAFESIVFLTFFVVFFFSFSFSLEKRAVLILDTHTHFLQSFKSRSVSWKQICRRGIPVASIIFWNTYKISLTFPPNIIDIISLGYWVCGRYLGRQCPSLPSDLEFEMHLPATWSSCLILLSRKSTS